MMKSSSSIIGGIFGGGGGGGHTIRRIGLISLICFLLVLNTFRGFIQFIDVANNDDGGGGNGGAAAIGFEIPITATNIRGGINDDSANNIVHKIKRQVLNTTEERNETIAILSSRIPTPKFLLGILSHDLPGTKEYMLRNALRDTYLSYYKDNIDGKSATTPNRICQLTAILKSDHPIKEFGECQLAYAFVIGGGDNETRPTELLNVRNSTSMILPHPEEDVVNLNIQENGKYGKTPTWLRYATLIQKEYNLPIDYVIKTDSDTLFSPRMFFKWIEQQEVDYFFPSTSRNSSLTANNATNILDNNNNNNNNTTTIFRRERIFGGSPFDKKMCGWPRHTHCGFLTAPLYMGGAFYFFSSDLADYISSDRCPRKQIFIPHEDVTNGNYVFSHPDLITTFENKRGYRRMWRHPLKHPKGIYKKYMQFLSEEGVEGVSELIDTKKKMRKRDEAKKKNRDAEEKLKNRTAKKERTTSIGIMSLEDLKNVRLRKEVRNKLAVPDTLPKQKRNNMK